MTPETLVFGVLATVAVLHLLTMGLVYLFGRRGTVSTAGFDDAVAPGNRDERPPRNADRAAAPDAADGSVRCPDCGTPNEQGYVFCRQCVSRLPGGGRGDQTGGSPYAGQPP
jgi:hypothetical protein